MIALVVLTAYVAIGTTTGVLMAVYAHDPGGAVVLGIFSPFIVAMLLLCVFLIAVAVDQIFG